MKFEKEKLPVIHELEGRPVTDVSFEDLKESGVSTSWGLRENDVIEFPAIEEMTFKKQPVRKNSTAMMYLASVIRNGNPSWLSIGSLRRLGKDMEASCPFVKEMNEKYDRDHERIRDLAGKTIKVTGTKMMDTYRFTPDGVRTNDIVQRPFPIIEVQ